jgi:cobalt/nickel transport system permease protein
MHMADALLSPAVGTTFWAGSLAAIVYCSRKVRESTDEKIIPLMGVLGAFIFAAQMINFTIPGTGSSGHLTGGMILAVILGPYAAFIVMASVLTIQAFFFADGGLLALGSNIWNLGAYSCFIAYPLIYRTVAGRSSSSKRIMIASVSGSLIGLMLGSFSVVLQTTLSGRSELPFLTFASVMLPVHLVIGLIEGVVTAGVLNFIRLARPEILLSTPDSKHPGSTRIRGVFIAFLMVALFTGGALSWFASENPDGLEWSVRRILGDAETPGQEGGLLSSLKRTQEKTAFLPDYAFRPGEGNQGNGTDEAFGRSISGITGSLAVLFAIITAGWIIKRAKRK